VSSPFDVSPFTKSDRANLRRAEFKAVQTLADQLLSMDDAALGAMLSNGTIKEVICNDQTVRK